MLGTNIFSSLFTGVSLLVEGLLFSNLLLCLQIPALAWDVIGMSIFSMTGAFLDDVNIGHISAILCVYSIVAIFKCHPVF